MNGTNITKLVGDLDNPNAMVLDVANGLLYVLEGQNGALLQCRLKSNGILTFCDNKSF